MGGCMSIRYSTGRTPARDRRHVPSVRSRSSVCDWRQRITMLSGAFFVLKVEWIVAVAISLTTQLKSRGVAVTVIPLALSGGLVGVRVGAPRETPVAADSVPVSAV